MMQFQENPQTDGRTDGRTEGWRDPTDQNYATFSNYHTPTQAKTSEK